MTIPSGAVILPPVVPGRAAGSVVPDAFTNGHTATGGHRFGPRADIREWGVRFGTANGDQTANVQDALDDHAQYGTLFIPVDETDGGIIRLEGMIDLPTEVYGKVIRGEGRDNTRLVQYESNTPILRITGNHHSMALENFTLEYNTQQTSSDTAAVGLQLWGETLSNFYHSTLKNIRIHRAYDGLGVDGTSGSNVGFWANTVEGLWITSTAHSGVYMIPPSIAGQPSNVFVNLEVNNTNSGGLVSTGPAVQFAAYETRIVGLAVEGWYNEAFWADSGGQHTIIGMHVESHFFTGANPRLIRLSGDPLTLYDLSLAATNSGTGILRIINAAAGSVFRGVSARYHITGTAPTSAHVVNGSTAGAYILEDYVDDGSSFTVANPASEAATLAVVKRSDQTTQRRVRTVTGTDTATWTDEILLCDAAGGAFTETLPAAQAMSGRELTIKRTSASNNVTVDGNASETIDGATTKVLTTQYAFIRIVSNGTAWSIVASGGTVT